MLEFRMLGPLEALAAELGIDAKDVVYLAMAELAGWRHAARIYRAALEAHGMVRPLPGGS
jgi:hypothetical protein